MWLTMSVTNVSGVMSLHSKCARSPTPVWVGVVTWYPILRRLAATSRQHHPPCQAPCTSTYVFITDCAVPFARRPLWLPSGTMAGHCPKGLDHVTGGKSGTGAPWPEDTPTKSRKLKLRNPIFTSSLQVDGEAHGVPQLLAAGMLLAPADHPNLNRTPKPPRG